MVDTEAEKRLDPTSRRLDRTVEGVLNPHDEYAVGEAVAVRKARAMGADQTLMSTDAQTGRVPTAASALLNLPLRSGVGSLIMV